MERAEGNEETVMLEDAFENGERYRWRAEAVARKLSISS